MTADALLLGEALGPVDAARTRWEPVGPYAVPLEIATQTIGILGQKGAGKSNTEVRLAELFYAAGIPWVAVDPKGDWWGIRSSASGDEAGLEVPILGGLHGDVPLGDQEGALWADVIVDATLTCVLDVSDFSKGERGRFLVAFFDRLYRRHRQDPHVRHVFLEEAHEYIPQQVGREEGRLKEAAARIVLQGRTFGLGASACSQRSARLHKDVLTQIGTLVAHRTTGPQDRKAIEDWVKEHDLDRELVASLPSLRSGEAWFWSPEFLGSMTRVQVDRRETYDSGATPTVGMASRQHATLADVDLAAIKERMAESIEKAKDNDPAELRRRLAAAEARIRELEAWTPPPPAAGLAELDRRRLLDARAKAVAASHEFVLAMSGLSDAVDVAAEEREMLTAEGAKDAARRIREARSRAVPAKKQAAAPHEPRPDGDAPNPDSAAGKVLAVLALHPGGLPQRRAGFLAGYSSRKTTVRNAVTKLRAAGLVEGSSELLRATSAGVAVAAPPAVPTGGELLEHWRRQLGGTKRDVFDLLWDEYPAEYGDAAVCEALGLDPGKSTVRNAKTHLRALGLLDGNRVSAALVEAVRGG